MVEKERLIPKTFLIRVSDWVFLGEIGKEGKKNNASKGLRIVIDKHRISHYNKGRPKKTHSK